MKRSLISVWIIGGSLRVALLCFLAPSPSRSQGITLVGAGATFPEPLYQKWFETRSRKGPIDYPLRDVPRQSSQGSSPSSTSPTSRLPS